MHSSSSFGKVLGLPLVILGMILIYFLLPIEISLGLLVALFATWSISILIFTGCSLIIRLKLKTYIKSLLAGNVIFFLFILIFLSPLSIESQLLLANIALVTLVLMSRFSLRRKKSKRDVEQ